MRSKQMKELIRQQALVGYMDRAWTNTLKLGQAKITEFELKTRLERMDEYWSRIQEQNFKLVAFEEIEKTNYYKNDMFSNSEESYLSNRAKFLTAMSNLAPKIAMVEPADASATPLIKQMQLPKMSLPKFSGDHLAWESFRDLFRSLVHDVPSISPVQKLQYLKSCLSGETADVIANAPLTDAEYEGAWTDLMTRYDNGRILLFVHMRNLLLLMITEHLVNRWGRASIKSYLRHLRKAPSKIGDPKRWKRGLGYQYIMQTIFDITQVKFVHMYCSQGRTAFGRVNINSSIYQ
ncbi:PREDICTED: uncharacterized protein LOC105454009 isoform X2 [Wasmannia auropunctata]|uniref:uncharacterized protein LOC105454009 isoform X2 n=1 Tax=Wasmannia auropunctata TaxID=64793 RepID=UPI0005ED46AF|nr:PREDICTED: uncharacterized protein LOC105454009 isoform X2 [Wasmannia auropunctata]